MEPVQRRYEHWLQEFRRLAAERDLGWVLSDRLDAHRSAFESGLSPDEELRLLADLAQWRGCGCGAG